MELRPMVVVQHWIMCSVAFSDKNPNIMDTPVLDVGPSIISELIGTNRRALAHNFHVNEVDSQSNASLTKKSPLKLLKNIKIKKRRTSRTTSDVWDHFTAKESEEELAALVGGDKVRLIS
uniref:Uncharacterized protein n=1 Tax=Oryza punctata TaxID=4537 RepID=A0A0E0KNY0_ORYPU